MSPQLIACLSSLSRFSLVNPKHHKKMHNGQPYDRFLENCSSLEVEVRYSILALVFSTLHIVARLSEFEVNASASQ